MNARIGRIEDAAAAGTRPLVFAYANPVPSGTGRGRFALGSPVGLETSSLSPNNTASPRAPRGVGNHSDEIVHDLAKAGSLVLDDANAPQEDRWIGVSPAAETSLMKLDEVVHRDYDVLHGDPQYKTLNKAYLGTFLGMPIYKSTNIEGTNAAGHDSVMAQKECIALVMQMNATTHVQFDINYLASKVVVEHLYGSAALRIDHGVWLKSK